MRVNSKTPDPTKFGDRAFAAAGPRAWNSLSHQTRSISYIDSFKIKLKTVLFSYSYTIDNVHCISQTLTDIGALESVCLCYGA